MHHVINNNKYHSSLTLFAMNYSDTRYCVLFYFLYIFYGFPFDNVYFNIFVKGNMHFWFI